MKYKQFILVLLLSVMGCNIALSQLPANIRQCKEEFRSYFDMLQLPGLSLAVVKDGKVIYRQMEGYADLEKRQPMGQHNLFQIASVTKTFTAALLMQYEQEGKM